MVRGGDGTCGVVRPTRTVGRAPARPTRHAAPVAPAAQEAQEAQEAQGSAYTGLTATRVGGGSDPRRIDGLPAATPVYAEDSGESRS